MRRIHTWQGFIAEYGYRASNRDLAAVLGRELEEIIEVKKSGIARSRKQPLKFHQLFELWHGRAPKEADWPPPRTWRNGKYEWQGREIALLFNLAGRIGPEKIAIALTERLRQVTGNPKAMRSKSMVIMALSRHGGSSNILVDGISIRQAAAEYGHSNAIRDAIEKKELHAYKVGRLFCIPREAWGKWKATRQTIPEGLVRLASLKQPLSIKSDKLAEFARAGLVPGARCIKRTDAPGPSTQFGTWYIDSKLAKKLIADRRKGRPMPWHGMPNKSNLQVTFRLWRKRRHPEGCEECQRIWGKKGAPRGFEEYAGRYAGLTRLQKLHLTKRWLPGLNQQAAARLAACSHAEVLLAVKNRLLPASRRNGTLYLMPKDVLQWRKQGCPTSSGSRSYITLATACDWYFFSEKELRKFIARGLVDTIISKTPATWKQPLLAKHHLRLLREKQGFTIEMGARVAGIGGDEFSGLMRECGFRVRKKHIPVDQVYAVRKKWRDRTYRTLPGYSLKQAANLANASLAWIRARVADGTVKVQRDRQDRRRLYLSATMIKRLLAYRRGIRRTEPADGSWLTLDQASVEAGVSIQKLREWIGAGDIAPQRFRHGLRYSRAAVRKRAAKYWASSRFLRMPRPKWLLPNAANKNLVGRRSVRAAA